MLQVPCLSPPIYGHSHYKKFWLRQTADTGGSPSAAAAAAAVSCEMKSGSTTTSSPDVVSKRICGKRRPQLRASASSIKVALNHESSVSASPTSSAENFGWKRSSPRDGDTATNSSPLSTVDNRDDDAEETPKSFVLGGGGADHKFLLPHLNGGCQAEDDLQNEEDQEIEEDEEDVAEDKAIASCDDHSIEQTGAASLDCLTSKCKVIDTTTTDSRQEELDEQEEAAADHNSSSESDSATSSTSQAEDDHDEDARSHSVKSSFRQYLKRQSSSKLKTGLDEPGKAATAAAAGVISAAAAAAASFGSSPKTRQASAAAAAAAVHDPVSPSGRSSSAVLGSSSPINSPNNVSRTCKHCGTMKTPLWRNGPLGPKSLCNACGIRLRKARRNSNNQEGGGNQVSATTTTVTTTGMPTAGKRKLSQTEATIISGLTKQHPYKKSRVPFAREKREMKSMMRLLPHLNPSSHKNSNNNNNSDDEDEEEENSNKSFSGKMFGRSVSKDEEEGAVLLMALSCGLVLA